jgi:integrator complex subunit 3
MLSSGASEREAHDILNATVCRGMQEHEEVSLGLLYGMLVNPARAQMFYSDLTFTTRDGLGLVVGQLEMLVMEKYRRMKDLTRKQVLPDLLPVAVANGYGCYEPSIELGY